MATIGTLGYSGGRLCDLAGGAASELSSAKLGFAQTGHTPQFCPPDGACNDDLVYSDRAGLLTIL